MEKIGPGLRNDNLNIFGQNESKKAAEKIHNDLTLWENINNFEELKKDLIKQLNDLKNGHNIVATNTQWMGKKIMLFNHFMEFQEIEKLMIANKGQSETLNFKELDFLERSKSLENSLISQVKDLKRNCEKLFHQRKLLEEKVHSLEVIDDSIKNEIAEVHWQLRRYQSLASELENELLETKSEMLELQREQEVLLNEKNAIEEELWGKKIEIIDMKNVHSSSDGYFSPLKRLEAMKIAFEENESIILKHKLQIEEQKQLIDYYEKYCCGLRKLIKSRKTKQKVSLDDAKLQHCEGVQTEPNLNILKIGDIQSSTVEETNNEIALKLENGILKETVSSLTFLIEKLMQQNEQNITKFPYVKDSEASSSLTSPRSEISPAESLKSALVFNQGSGDNVNENDHVVVTLEKETLQSLGHLSNNEFQSNSEVSQIFDDLSRMAKSAQTLEQSAREIISVSLGHMNCNPQS